MTRPLRVPRFALIASVLFVASVPSTGAFGDDSGQKDLEGEALKEKVIFQIHQNDFRLPAIRCKVMTTSLDSRVKVREVVRAATPGGGSIEFTRAPKSVVELDLILSRENMRADGLDLETNQRWSVSMCRDIWTTYSPAAKFARRQRREEMGGEGNIDPRQVGVFEARKNLVQELKRFQVERHETIRRAGAERIVLDLSESFAESKQTATTHYEFDPARNHLPTRLIGTHPDTKKIIWVYDIDYQRVPSKSAWFLKQSRVRYFASESPPTPDEEDGWTQQVITEVIGPLRTEETIAESDFRIELPHGLHFVDPSVPR